MRIASAIKAPDTIQNRLRRAGHTKLLKLSIKGHTNYGHSNRINLTQRADSQFRPLQIDTLRRQYARILTDMGFVDRQMGWEAYNEYAADTYLVRAVLCSGLYPQIVAVNVRARIFLLLFSWMDAVRGYDDKILSSA